MSLLNASSDVNSLNNVIYSVWKQRSLHRCYGNQGDAVAHVGGPGPHHGALWLVTLNHRVAHPVLFIILGTVHADRCQCVVLSRLAFSATTIFATVGL